MIFPENAKFVSSFGWAIPQHEFPCNLGELRKDKNSFPHALLKFEQFPGLMAELPPRREILAYR